MGFFDFFRRPPPPPAPPPSDPARLRTLLARIGDVNNPDVPRPLVTLAEFFEGNNDFASIGYNLAHVSSPQGWYVLLKGIAARPDVHDVRIQILDVPGPDEWPSTDTLWIITSADIDEVRTWIPDRFGPDDIFSGFAGRGPLEPYPLPPGMNAIGIWYD